MPTYPSSLYKGVAPSSLGSNVTGSTTVSNITIYRELADIVNGASDVSLAFNSAAKYPTDTNIGTEIITNRTQTIANFATAVSRLSTVLGNYTTAIAACDAKAALTANEALVVFTEKLAYDAVMAVTA